MCFYYLRILPRLPHNMYLAFVLCWYYSKKVLILFGVKQFRTQHFNEWNITRSHTTTI